MAAAEIGLILANILITACSSIAARLGMATMEPLPFAVLSLLVAAPPLAWIAARGGTLSQLWHPRFALPLMGLGLLGTSLTSLLLFYAGKTVPASRIVILCQLEILVSLAFGAMILKERVGAAQLGATALILCGMLIALRAGRFEKLGTGDALVLGMPFCFQLSHLISKPLLAELSPGLVSAGRTIYGLAFLLPLIPFLAPSSAWASCLANPRALALILFQGVVINAVSLLLWYGALARVDLSKVTTLLLTYPLVTLLLTKFLPGLNEHVSPLQFAGAALVVAGGSLLSRLPSGGRNPLKNDELNLS